ncbi:hypothetical protein JOM56_008227 [Amanita muscaria]
MLTVDSINSDSASVYNNDYMSDDVSENDAQIEYLLENPPVPTILPNPTAPSLIPGETLLSYSERCLDYTFNNQAPDEQWAKAFFQLFQNCGDTLLQHVDRKSFNPVIAQIEHTTDEENMRRCEATALTITTLTESLRKAENTCIPLRENLDRERNDHIRTKQMLNRQVISLTMENTRLKKKVVPKKRNTSKVPILGASEIRPYDTDSYFFSEVEDSVKKQYPTVPPSPTSDYINIDTKDDPIISSSPTVSLPKRDFLMHKDNKSFQIRDTRAMSAPIENTQQREPAPPRAQTAPPSLSCNTLTARRCTSKGPSPNSYVKFLDVPYLSQERYMEMLKENTKWSTAKVSRIETFGMKTAQGNWNIKICFKDDEHSTIVKKLLTTSITFDTAIRRCRHWYLQTRPSTQHA